MRGEMRGEPIKRLLNHLIIGDTSRASRQAAQPGRTLTIVGKQSVDVGAEHAAVGGYRSLRRTVVEPCKRARAVRPCGDAHVHLIATKRCAAIRRAADRLKSLVLGKYGFDVKQAEAGDFARRTFDSLRVGDGASQHLKTTA